MQEKAVVLLSGGIDSSTLLYKLNSEGYECYPISILYGQRHKKEVEAATAIASSLGMELRHAVIDLSILRTLLPSSLTGVGNIPYGHYTDPSMSKTVVPGRNLILLSIATGYAQGLGAKYVGLCSPCR